MDIRYEIYDYQDNDMNNKIVGLYKKVFHTEFNNLGYFFEDNPFGKPIGVVALNENKEVIGHFATMATEAFINSKKIKGRISMGFMVEEDYQGHSIAKNLANILLAEVSKDEQCNYVIGFPNDNSLYMHKKYMGYTHIRDYYMVKIENLGYDQNKSAFKVVSNIPTEKSRPKLNIINHSSEMMNWRYQGPSYEKYCDDKDNYYICNRYRNTIQILYWSPIVTKDDLVNFAGFLYSINSIESVRTWNSFDWLNCFEKEERAFHFTVNTLNKDFDMYIAGKWCFFPGDCELF